jgi:hypothetical protein
VHCNRTRNPTLGLFFLFFIFILWNVSQGSPDACPAPVRHQPTHLLMPFSSALPADCAIAERLDAGTRGICICGAVARRRA